MVIATQLMILCLMLAAGFVLGLLYFYGLWRTLREPPGTKGWGARLLVSFIVRVSLVIGAFFLLMGNDWQRLAALTVGFVLARFVMVRRMGCNRKAGAA